MKEDCGSRLEHAFDFMEAAFGTGQEMVIFVTELNTSEASSGHIGGSLSVADILAVLYFEKMRVDPKDSKNPGRDISPVPPRTSSRPALFTLRAMILAERTRS